MKPHFLYRIVAPDGRQYVGVSRYPRRRFNEHCRDRGQPAPCPAIFDAIRKFGRSNMRFELLACGPRDYIYDLEAKAVNTFSTRWPNGFNVAVGGFSSGMRDPLPSTIAKLVAANTGRKMSDETRAKLSVANTGKPSSLKGTKLPAEWAAKCAAAKLGRKHPPISDEARANYVAAAKLRGPPTAETLAKMVMAAKLRPPPSDKCRAAGKAALANTPHWNIGGTASAETRAKQSAAAKRRGPSAASLAGLKASLKGRTYSVETRQNLSAAAKKRAPPSAACRAASVAARAAKRAAAAAFEGALI